MIIALNNIIRSVLTKELQITYASTRCFSKSGLVSKRYKYALNRAYQKNPGGSKGKSRKNFIYGDKTVTYFTLQDFDSESDGTEEIYNPKQKVYSEYIEDAVKDLLSSNEVDETLRNCPIEIVDVEVSDSLASAYIVWKISNEVPSEEKADAREKTKSLLSKNLAHIRSLLPAFTSLTNAPNVHFVYDILSERRAELEKLLDSVKDEIEEFETKNQNIEQEIKQE
ncbi:putative ribosome-binding factor A, mitochondrial [Clytia hemisphaerica]|uniref:Uncharacterized protein n=1 Tax=Clytia hemisphaerica TaxID=252671 RepID=A0A7M5UNG0_9CNID|eukprot:TCONS_00055044-protein